MSLRISIVAGEALLEPVEIKDKDLAREVGVIARQIAKAVKQDLIDKEKNEPIVFSFKHNDQILDPKLKMGECGIKNGDRITLTNNGGGIKYSHNTEDLKPKKSADTIELLIEAPGVTKFTENVPVNTIIQELINKIINDKKLAQDKRYELFSRHLGKSLLPGTTVGQNNIPPRDLLTLTADAVPGFGLI